MVNTYLILNFLQCLHNVIDLGTGADMVASLLRLLVLLELFDNIVLLVAR